MYTYLPNSYNTPTILYLKNWNHTVTGGCDARGQCSYGNVCLIHTTIDTSTETANDEVKQIWYSNNSSAVESMAGVKNGGNTYRPKDQTFRIAHWNAQNLQRPSS